MALVVVVVPIAGTIAALWLALHGTMPSYLDIALFLALFVATGIGVEAGMHRHFSHQAFKASHGVRAFLAIFGSMAGQGPVLFWAITHRRHHAHSDRPGDPHSPHWFENQRLSPLSGWWHAYMGWLFTHDVTDWTRWGPDLVKDRHILRWTDRYLAYIVAGLIVPALLGGLVEQTWMGALGGLLWGGLVRMFAVQHFTWLTNALCHMVGDRPQRARDRSTNLWWLALPSFGMSWHNNHHAFPSLAKNDIFWWQLDPSGWFVGLCERLGLVWDAHGPTEKMRKLAWASTPVELDPGDVP